MSVDPSTSNVRFDLDLDSIPGHKLNGYEVVIDFQVSNFNNNGSFFTDSNGLEMQQRWLNYRKTWDIQTNMKHNFENITSNFYPVTSAFSMQAGSKKFTVLNDRAQSAAALTPGGIQFMQNRRIPANDHRGLDEFLDERNEFGNGIRVPATYYV